MTPPDSDGPRVYRPGDPEYFHALASDAREFRCEACPRAFSSAPALAMHERRWHGATQAEMEAREDGVSLPLPLAQRILAALDHLADARVDTNYTAASGNARSLAADLRAVIGK